MDQRVPRLLEFPTNYRMNLQRWSLRLRGTQLTTVAPTAPVGGAISIAPASLRRSTPRQARGTADRASPRRAASPTGEAATPDGTTRAPSRHHRPLREQDPVPGRIVATPEAIRALRDAGQAADEFLARHFAGDGGELDDEDECGTTPPRRTAAASCRRTRSAPASGSGSSPRRSMMRDSETGRRCCCPRSTDRPRPPHRVEGPGRRCLHRGIAGHAAEAIRCVMRFPFDSHRTGPAGSPMLIWIAVVSTLRGLRGLAAHNAVGLAGESPVVGIDCLPT